jgi:hypothetical protein
LGAERGPRTPAERAQVLQGYLCERAASLPLPDDAGMLKRQLQGHLVSACDAGVLAMRQHDVLARLKLSDRPLDGQPECKGIYGGEKDFKRTGDKPCFRRRDGAFFHFSITVRPRRGQPLELVAYDFELCFSDPDNPEARAPRFVRFDLNEPAHGNESRGLRCHLHPGHDDLIAPAPLLSPVELLDLFLGEDLALPARARGA